MADYPNSIFSPTTLVDGSDYPQAAHINLPNAEIVALETVLGVNPTTIDDTVSPGSSPASVAAYLDMIANIVKNLSGQSNWYDAAVNIATGTITFTNKRITPRITTETSSATPTINTDNTDIHTITALAAAITSFTTNLSGTPTHGQRLVIEILDNGTARAITHGASFRGGSGCALLTTTVLSKLCREVFMWDSVDSVWDCVGVWVEA